MLFNCTEYVFVLFFLTLFTLPFRSPEFSNFLKRCLDKNVDNRWSATQLLQVPFSQNVWAALSGVPEYLFYYYVLHLCTWPLKSTDNPSYPPHLHQAPATQSVSSTGLDDICVPLRCQGQNHVSWQDEQLVPLRLSLRQQHRLFFFHWVYGALQVRATYRQTDSHAGRICARTHRTFFGQRIVL